jgi:4'-phosphopantetheinyl transferase
LAAERNLGQDRVVTVWRVGLDPGDRAAEPLRGHLSLDEIERLERLRGSEVGRRWLISRAALREILAAELGGSPSSVRLQLGAHGRPALDPGIHPTDLDFNLSHSGDVALVAVARGLRVGIDVERLRRGRDPLRIADRYFSEAEVEAVRTFPQADRPAAFLRYWTAKEALAKGLGLGLRAPIGQLELAPRPGGTMVPVRLARDWRLVELTDLPSGYCGALAVDDEAARVVIRDWPLGAAASPRHDAK